MGKKKYSEAKTLREEMRKSGKTDGGKGKSKDKENKPKGPGRTPSTDSKDGKRRQTPVATPAARTDDETSGKEDGDKKKKRRRRSRKVKKEGEE